MKAMLFMMPSFWVADLNLLFATMVQDGHEGIIGAQIILRSFATLLAIIPFSFSCSSGFFIGKAIGNENKEAILKYYRVSVYYAAGMGAFFCLILSTAQMPIYHLYTR